MAGALGLEPLLVATTTDGGSAPLEELEERNQKGAAPLEMPWRGLDSWGCDSREWEDEDPEWANNDWDMVLVPHCLELLLWVYIPILCR